MILHDRALSFSLPSPQQGERISATADSRCVRSGFAGDFAE